MADAPEAGGRYPVLVVGAGPVGLAAALALRAQGLPVTILEAEPRDRTRPGSRAIYVHGETLRHLQGMHGGLGERIAGHGITWRTKRTFWGDREVFARTYPTPPPTRLPAFTSLPQAATEGLLLDACEATGVRVAWDSPVTGVEATPGGVTVTTADGQAWSTGYVIGADGARSAVRDALGLDLHGSRSENTFVIVDVDEDPDVPLAPERRFYYEHPAVGGRNVLLVPFAGGWRADLQCRPDDDPRRFSEPDGVRRWIARVLPEPYAERVAWISDYRFLQVLARDFVDTHRRVLLVGEAAHLFAPFGARGMNSGVVDAAAAATAVRAALDATDLAAAREAVEAFAATRRRAAEHNRAAASAALAHLRARGPAARLKRRAAAAIATLGRLQSSSPATTPLTGAAATIAAFGRRAGEWLDAAPYGPRQGPDGQASGRY